ncbi:hypothetical protein COT97_02415 [Candidatus Falkowbacteria bacterium CG10_big_fil_rev_8_21_14_0_10_39_11]|uniref:Uncharacterized protein n=1 Tax=Candidatus Falkowbacteria bacterium CG10_big_fil_rev_8_21_14_0_10_39_11 TaxID=1974565 RepID=A0A2H0V5H3_9BACT|nr:MAG: hypothetical protein COT97_02415 [Candidatus Falkowbacteria bacterium CG10_big_fil_rev_8_21_14_0_10_39_11]
MNEKQKMTVVGVLVIGAMITAGMGVLLGVRFENVPHSLGLLICAFTYILFGAALMEITREKHVFVLFVGTIISAGIDVMVGIQFDNTGHFGGLLIYALVYMMYGGEIIRALKRIQRENNG